MKYYRTYVTSFTRSNGLHWYVGKHESKFGNPEDDPYFGSGLEIKAAVRKYGKSCIQSITWFNHSSEFQMNESEKFLVRLYKMIYGNRCTNYAAGGNGGNTMEYMDPTAKTLRIQRIKLSHCTDEYRDNTSKTSTKMWKSDSHRQKVSSSMTEVHSDSDYKKMHRTTTKSGIRKNRDHFNEPLKRIIYDTWIENNKPGDHKLSKILQNCGYVLTRSKLYCLLDEFRTHGYLTPEISNA